MKYRWVLLSLCLAIVFSASFIAHAEEPIVLRYWRHNYQPANDLDKLAIEEFERNHPNVKVELNIIPSPRELEKQILTAMVGGIGPDIANISSGWVAVFVEGGAVLPVIPESFGVSTLSEFEAMWLPGAFGAYRLGDRIYGVPSELSAYAFWINRDHFEEAGIDPDTGYPRTWEEVASVGQKLTKTTMGRISRQGFVQRIDAPWGFESMVHQLGGNLLTPDGKHSLFNSPEVVEALRTKQDFVHKHKISDPTIQVDPLELFGTGQASMSDYGGSWAVALYANDYPECNYKTVAYPRYANGPVDTGGTVYGYAQVVSANTKHPELAWEFVNTLASYPEKYISAGLFQPRLGWFESEAARNFPDFDLWLDELSKGTYHFWSTAFQEIAQVIVTAMEETLMTQGDVEEVLGRAHKEVEAILARQADAF